MINLSLIRDGCSLAKSREMEYYRVLARGVVCSMEAFFCFEFSGPWGNAVAVRQVRWHGVGGRTKLHDCTAWQQGRVLPVLDHPLLASAGGHTKVRHQ